MHVQTSAAAYAELQGDILAAPNLTIWKDIVNGLINQVKPKAYEEAALYLRFMKKVYTRNHRLEDW